MDDKQAKTSRRVFFVTNSDGFGGTEKHLIELVKRMADAGERPTIVQVGSDVYTRILNERGIASVSVINANLQKSPLAWYSLFRNQRPDVLVFVNNWLGSFPWHAVIAASVAGVTKRFAIHHLIAPPLIYIKRT